MLDFAIDGDGRVSGRYRTCNEGAALPRRRNRSPLAYPRHARVVSEFAVTNCVLRRYGLTLYATYDVGVGYQTTDCAASDYSLKGCPTLLKNTTASRFGSWHKSARISDIVSEAPITLPATPSSSFR